ncbi:MAG: transporter [Salibacteraceae bacterium]
MKKTFRSSALVGTICLLASLSAFSQPVVDGFMKGKGNMDVVGSYNFETFSKYFASTGKVPISRTTQSASLFVAAGLTSFLDVQVSVPYVITKKNFTNFQDMSVYLKWRFLNKSTDKGTLSFMTTAGFGTPMSNYNTESLYAIGQQASAFDGRLVAQYFLKTGWFFMAQTGYTLRSEPTPSSIPAAIKVGLAKDKFYFDFYYDFQYALGGTDYLDGSNSKFTTLGVSYHKLGGTFYKPILKGKAGLAFGAYSVISGRNVGQSIGASAAFIYKIKYRK